MANQILKLHSLSKTPRPLLSLYSFSTTSSPPSDQPDPIPTVASILTHPRSKSRWSTVLTLFPSGFTPSQFSKMAVQLKDDPHLAQRFFRFTQKNSLRTHNLSSYSTMIHILSRLRRKALAREHIRISIRTPGAENGPPTHLKLFESLVKFYNECGSSPFVFDLLVKSCLQMDILDGSIEIVRMSMSRGISPHVSSCNALIWEVSKCRGANKGYEVYKEIFGVGNGEGDSNVKSVSKVKQNVYTFNYLMMWFYRQRLSGKVEEIWSEMESSGCVPNFNSRIVLLAALCQEGKMGKAEELWEEMRFRGLKLETVPCSFMIGGYCKSGEMMKAEELYREMRSDACCEATYESLINGYCRVADIDSAMLI